MSGWLTSLTKRVTSPRLRGDLSAKSLRRNPFAARHRSTSLFLRLHGDFTAEEILLCHKAFLLRIVAATSQQGNITSQEGSPPATSRDYFAARKYHFAGRFPCRDQSRLLRGKEISLRRKVPLPRLVAATSRQGNITSQEGSPAATSRGYFAAMNPWKY